MVIPFLLFLNTSISCYLSILLSIYLSIYLSICLLSIYFWLEIYIQKIYWSWFKRKCKDLDPYSNRDPNLKNYSTVNRIHNKGFVCKNNGSCRIGNPGPDYHIRYDTMWVYNYIHIVSFRIVSHYIKMDKTSWKYSSIKMGSDLQPWGRGCWKSLYFPQSLYQC